MKQYLGIDISKHKLDVLWIKDLTHKKIKTKVFPNHTKGFEALKTWLQQHVSDDFSSIYIALEATGVYHEGVAYALHDYGVQLSVMNPARIREFAKSIGAQNKTDKKDSMVLARYMATVAPALWVPEPNEVRVLRALIARHKALQEDLIREKNRLEKSQVSNASSQVIESIQQMIQALEKEMARVEKSINDHIDNYPTLKQDQKLLKSIPGIGNVLSREMISIIRSRSFKTAAQAAAFLGVTPKIIQSGLFQGRSRMSKNGNTRVRAALYMAAMTSTNHNPDIKRLYQRLINNGKPKMLALGAAMRKLVHICFGVLKNQTPYLPQNPCTG